MKNRTFSTANLLTGEILPLLALLAIAILFWGCRKNSGQVFQGYAEGEFVLVAAPSAGRLEKLAVARGARVGAGDLLFILDREEEQAAVMAAEQEMRRADNRLEDLRKGQRPSELEAVRARLEQARSALELSRREFERRKELFAQKFISGEELDRARSALSRDRAAVAEMQAQLETARLGARSDAVEAARAEREAARARLDQARWALEQKTQGAPREALVFDTLFEPGEFVQAGYPVVNLLPPGNIKIRFFVPEPVIGAMRVGQPVSVVFDGSDGALPATVTFISPEVEYTPPVIYSRETRAKLVFMVEARPSPAAASRFHPGQPLEVRMEPGP